MISKSINLTKLIKPFENMWVALSLDNQKVLASGKTLETTRTKADRTNKKYRFLKVAPFDISFVPRV